METLLKEKLWGYIIDNNPDLMFSLQENYSVVKYLNDKVNSVLPLVERLKSGDPHSSSVIMEKCMEELTKELKPSKFNYLRNILLKNFKEQFLAFLDAGLLAYEIINMMEACAEIFDRYRFSEANIDDIRLREEVKGMMDYYLSKLAESA